MSTLLQSTFTGADGTNVSAITMEVGPVWVMTAGNWTVQSNKAVPPASSSFVGFTADSSSADVAITFEVDVPSAASYAVGGLFRFTDDNNKWEFILQRDSGGTPYIYIWEVTSGSGNARTAFVNAVNATGTKVTMAITCSGNKMSGRLNTGEAVSFVSSVRNTATKHGVLGSTASGYTAGTYDNFLCVTLGSNGANLGGISTAPAKRYRAASLSLSNGANVLSVLDDMVGETPMGLTSGTTPTYVATTKTDGPAIRFAGSANAFQAAIDWSTATNLTIFVVRRATAMNSIFVGTGPTPNVYFGIDTSAHPWVKLTDKASGQLGDFTDVACEYISYNVVDGKYRNGRNNVTQEQNASGSLGVTDGQLYIGSSAGAGSYFTGDIYDVVIYTGALSSSDVAAVHAALMALYGINHAAGIVYDGDSITALICRQSDFALTRQYGAINDLSVGGSGISAIQARLSTALSLKDSARIANIYLLEVGTNDLALSGADVTACTNGLKAACESAKADGFLVAPATIPPRSAGIGDSNNAFEARRQTANATIKGWTSSTCDAVRDFGGDATMGPQAAASDTNLYSDGIHPTVLGASYFAAIDAAVIDGLTFNTAPTVTITGGAGTYVYGQHHLVTATATDAESGDLTDNIIWTSNIQGGTLEEGGELDTAFLVLGTHTITATITDTGSLSDTDTCTVIIVAATGGATSGSGVGIGNSVGDSDGVI